MRHPQDVGGDVESKTHAICSASSSHRWLNCPPSARLQLLYPNRSSVFAQEGTYVHELCEHKLRSHFYRVLEPMPYNKWFYNAEAERNSTLYAELVIKEYTRLSREYGEARVLVEERLDFSHIVPYGFGTGDAVVISPGEIHIFDYKNGKGVFVEVGYNPQMMLYALGAIKMYDADYKYIHMTIVQPRLDNIATFTISKEELLAWGEEVKPIAELAWQGKGRTVPGDWCKFCAHKYNCRPYLKEE